MYENGVAIKINLKITSMLNNKGVIAWPFRGLVQISGDSWAQQAYLACLLNIKKTNINNTKCVIACPFKGPGQMSGNGVVSQFSMFSKYYKNINIC